jgi:hypothetical protein
MGCSFFPDWSVDQFVRNRCRDHDAIYRNADASVWTKVKADCSLGWRVFWHGWTMSGRGTWYAIAGILMGIGSLLFGWWAWRFRKRDGAR